MECVTTSLLAIFLTLIAYLIRKAWLANKYWDQRGIPSIKPWLFFGNAGTPLFKKIPIPVYHKSICDQFPNEPVVGYYDMMRPLLLVQDAEIVEKILIKDFMYFTDRGFPVDEKCNPLDVSLLNMTGKRWKAMRNKLSPIFTSGKLRLMYDTMTECGEELVRQIGDQRVVEVRDVLERYTMDVIGSCAFGIETKLLQTPNSEFRRMGKKMFELDIWQILKFVAISLCPFLLKLFSIPFNKVYVMKYFSKIINDTIKYRREHGYVRNDLIQLMMQLQDKGYVEMHTKDPADDYLNIDHNSYSTEKFGLTTDQITGQAIIFFAAGFEGTTLTMMFTLYELSKQTGIQERVRQEVFREVKKAGALSYDAVKEMTYLEQCLNEAMRKYPPGAGIFRVCTKEYTLPNGVELELDQAVVIAMRALHYSPKYYPEPEQYKPERFNPGHNIPPCAFLPFGNGPRICIAMRFAMMEMKYCLAKLLMNYSFKINPRTKEPLTLRARGFFTAPNETILFDVEKVA